MIQYQATIIVNHYNLEKKRVKLSESLEIELKMFSLAANSTKIFSVV